MLDVGIIQVAQWDFFCPGMLSSSAWISAVISCDLAMTSTAGRWRPRVILQKQISAPEHIGRFLVVEIYL